MNSEVTNDFIQMDIPKANGDKGHIYENLHDCQWTYLCKWHKKYMELMLYMNMDTRYYTSKY